MNWEKMFKVLALTVWAISTVYFCYHFVTRKSVYVQKKIRMVAYKHANKDSLEVKQDQRFLEEYKYYDKPMRLLLFISWGLGILVGVGTYTVAWIVYFILRWLIKFNLGAIES